MAALHAAKQGYRVTVTERRVTPSSSAADRRTVHTYPMAVSPRAVAAIEAAGAKVPMLAPAGFYHGSVSAADGQLLFNMAPEGEDPDRARGKQSFLVDQVGLCRQVRGRGRAGGLFGWEATEQLNG